MLSTEIRQHNGAPALFVNGVANSGLAFWLPDVLSADNARCVAEFAGAGVRIVSAPFSLGAAIKGSGAYDFSRFDKQMEAIGRVDPGMLAMPRLDLTPSEAWLDASPAERMVHVDLRSGKRFARGGAQVSFSSRKWRELMQPALLAFIRHAEERHGDRIVGYHVGGGDCGEWSYMWADVLSDYSAPQQEAFRAWLRQRYGGDEAMLRAAWHEPGVSFGTAEAALDRGCAHGTPSLLDPAKDMRVIDYLEFHSDAVAAAILDFCRTAKQGLEEQGRRKVVAVFYGYHFWFLGFVCGYHNSGHHALAKVLACPDVDVLCAPGNYHDRHPGGFFSSQLIAGSVRLHGKLFYNEDDTRTHLTAPDAGWGRCPDTQASIGVLRRNLFSALAAGGTNWWMDQGGRGWYSEKALLDEVGSLGRFAADALRGDRSTVAQVAVIVSQESARFMRYDGALTDSALSRQLTELAAMGAPFDVYDATDLEPLFGGPGAAKYRLVIFLNCLWFPASERAALRRLVARDNRTLLWVYAGGLVTDHGLSTAAMAEVTGIRTEFHDRAWPLEVASFLTGERLIYGTHLPVSPVLVGADPEAEVHGWLRLSTHRDPDMPGLLEKDCGKWRSVWSAAPGLPAPLLSAICRRAGVHVYAGGGDQVMAAPGLLALHAARDGERPVRLPAPSLLTDAFNGETTDARTCVFNVAMRRGDTRVWKVRETSAGGRNGAAAVRT